MWSPFHVSRSPSFCSPSSVIFFSISSIVGVKSDSTNFMCCFVSTITGFSSSMISIVGLILTLFFALFSLNAALSPNRLTTPSWLELATEVDMGVSPVATCLISFAFSSFCRINIGNSRGSGMSKSSIFPKSFRAITVSLP